jgi:transposase
MRFYNGQHRHYCGVDLHTKRMYLCILDHEGTKLLHRNVQAKPREFLSAIEGFRDDLVVGAECMFTWYWLADVCLEEKVKFILGHALYMKAIHGGKKKDDKLDSEKIARLMRGGTFPLSYVYPREMRATRDLVRRRMFLVRRRSELLAHVQLVNQQYNHDPFEKMLKYAGNRDVLDRFEQPSVRLSVEADLATVGHYDQLLKQLETNLVRQATLHDPRASRLLRTIPGVGKIRDSHHRPFPQCWRFIVVRQASHAEADQRWQGHRSWRCQDRQRAFEVGFLRSSALDAPL